MAEVACFTASQITSALPPRTELLERLADSFVSLARGRIVLANPSHLQFEQRDADCCIKSAYKIGGAVRASQPLTWAVLRVATRCPGPAKPHALTWLMRVV